MRVGGAEPPTGYPTRFSVSPGAALDFHLRVDGDAFSASVVRLRGGNGSELVREEVTTIPLELLGPLARRRLCPGSFASFGDRPELSPAGALTALAWIAPTRPAAAVEQAVICKWSAEKRLGWLLGIDPEGRPMARIGGPRGELVLRAERRLAPGAWCGLALSCAAGGEAVLHVVPLEHGAAATRTRAALAEAPLAAPGRLLVAGRESAASPHGAVGAFDGKVEAPALLQAALSDGEATAILAGDDELAGRPGLIARWDFSREIGGARVVDLEAGGIDGELVNLPMRASTGRGWDGSELDWRHAPEQYGAIHFHVDDLGDAGWEASARAELPAGAESGVYALLVETGGGSCALPFVVTPPADRRPPVLLVLPWFTYLAYANDVCPERAAELGPERTLSLYDLHEDGSGCCTSSGLRPLHHLSPDYISPLTGAPRHLSADLLIVRWLEAEGVDFGVISDRELHREGLAALDGSQLVITGSHPEYVSLAMLDALEQFLAAGGSLTYLGGNGFYWVTSTHDEEAQAIEVRRGFAGTREWTSQAGECHHASSGEPGGLWRHRGRSPQRLVGIGFSAQGWGPGTGYRRTPASYLQPWAELFEGTREGETFGDYGLILGGAAGDEIDRAECALGTPPGAVVLATSGPHDDDYQPAIEDVLQTAKAGWPETRALVRSDLTVADHPGGGQVFSVGSMAWVGSLCHDDSDNDVARHPATAVRRALSSRGARVLRGEPA